MFWQVNERGIFVHINDDFVEFTGATERDLIGSMGVSVVEPDDLCRVILECMPSVMTREAHEVRLRIRHRETWGEVLAVAEPMYNHDGEFIGYCGMNKFIPTPRRAICFNCPFRARHPGACCRPD